MIQIKIQTKIAALVGGITGIASIVGLAWSGYSKVVDIHDNYATKADLTRSALTEQLDDAKDKVTEITDTISRYTTIAELNGSLSAADQIRLNNLMERLREARQQVSEHQSSLNDLAKPK